MHPRISIDPAICHGKACVRGTRIPVSQVLGMLASGDSAEEILQDFPSLELANIQACLAYTRHWPTKVSPKDLFQRSCQRE